MERLLPPNNLMPLSIIYTRLQKHWEQLKLFPLLLELCRLDRAGSLHQLVKLIWSIGVVILLLLLWG